MQKFTSKTKSLIRSLYHRHGRKKYGLCVCEGIKCCQELIAARADLIEYAVCSEKAPVDSLSIDFTRIPVPDFTQLSSTVTSQGVIMVARIPERISILKSIDSPFTVILDRVADPGNLGTILRTIKAVGLTEVWLTPGTVDPFGEKVIRAAAGFQFSLQFRESLTLEATVTALKKQGIKKVFRTDPHHGEVYYRIADLFDKSAIVLGNEAVGVQVLNDTCSVTIKMPGNIESLNVAQAATIILFEYVRNMGQ